MGRLSSVRVIGLACFLWGVASPLGYAQPEAGQDDTVAPPVPAEVVDEEPPVDEDDGDGEALPGEEDEDLEDDELDGEDDEAPPPPPPEVPPPPPIPSATDTPGAGTNTDVPINVVLHGYYRARLVTTDSQPVPNVTTNARDDAASAAYGFMRLRLEPSVIFGSDQANPVAALNMQLDVLDNVVFGDNARAAGTPLFAADPSATSLLDEDLSDYIFLRRLWLQLAIPIGQVRIGRQGSQGGLGLLFNDGNGFRNDFGDALDGTTFDRVLFATQPMTIVNTLVRGDSRPTPLVFALAYDWLAEDTLGVGRDPGSRRQGPFAFVTGGEDDVWQTTLALVWRDMEFNNDVNVRDELTAGAVLVHRGQDATASNIYIGDFFYRLVWSAFGRRNPSIYSEGELYTIQGDTNGVGLIGPIDPDTGRTGTQGHVNIWGGAARLGVDDPMWAAWLESGFSTGQEGSIMAIGTYDTLTARPSNSAYQVGLLLYPLALAVRTASQYGGDFRAVWSNGGVWNSVYLLPNVRIRPINGVEIIGQFLLAFADQVEASLSDSRVGATSTYCGLGEACILGWEADLAVKVSWGANDEMRWSNEFGIMNAGPALGPRLSQSLLWTLQTRIAFVF